MPSEINHRANIYAFKMMGVERVISISAVGSLKEELSPRDVVLPDQYFDRTKGGRSHTFFGDGAVAHVSFGDPTCPDMRACITSTITAELATGNYGATRLHNGGTYVNMEGPAFSTRAESDYYRRFDFDVIGMTSMPEAKLCREAELCYQPVAMVTDYDCWHAAEEPVTVEMIIGHLQANVALAKSIIRRLATTLPSVRRCRCGSALQGALITAPDAIPAATRTRLDLLIGKYVARK
jgi:5'-methylthioadenosine phosphorylase